MTEITLNPGDHAGLVEPDDRRRVPLGRYLTREAVRGFRVYTFNGGKTVVLEAIEEAS